MLRWRLLSAAVILGVLLTFMHLDFWHPPRGGADRLPATGLWMAPILLAFAILGTGEMLHLLSRAGSVPNRKAVYAGMLLITCASCVPMAWPLSGSPYPPDCPLGKLGWPLGASLLGLLMLAVVEMRHFRPGSAIAHMAGGFFIFGYLGLSLAFWAALRLFHDHQWGMAALVSMIVVVKLSDTGAYFTGRLIGRRKLAPKVSPGKTIEGSIGGLVFGMGGAFLFFYWAIDWLVPEPQRPPIWAVAVYGFVITVAGMLGDLFESLLKRDVDAKDSSTWLPGLGGVLDTVDSLLIAAPPAYLCWAAGLVGPG